MQQVIDAITADYKRLDPADAALLRPAAAAASRPPALAEYDSLIAAIKAEYAGTPVGASESIFAPLAAGARARSCSRPHVVPRARSARAPTRPPRDKATIDRQISDQQIKVYVFNSQNATPDVQAQVDAAKAAGHPGRHGHRDPDPGRRHVPGSGRSASSTASQRRWPRRPGSDALTTAPGPTPTARRPTPTPVAAGPVELRGAAVARRRPDVCGATSTCRGRRAASSSPCSARTASASRRCSRRSSACCRWPAGELTRARPAARARPTAQIGYLPQRRSFDAGPADPRRRRRPARAATATAGACRCPARRRAGRGRRARVDEVIDLVGAGAYAAPADRRSCSGGEQQRLLIAQALVRRPAAAAARRAAGQPRPAQPGRGRRADRADLPRARASPC